MESIRCIFTIQYRHKFTDSPPQGLSKNFFKPRNIVRLCLGTFQQTTTSSGKRCFRNVKQILPCTLWLNLITLLLEMCQLIPDKPNPLAKRLEVVIFGQLYAPVQMCFRFCHSFLPVLNIFKKRPIGWWHIKLQWYAKALHIKSKFEDEADRRSGTPEGWISYSLFD